MIKTLLVIIFSIAIVLSQDNLLTLLDEKDLDESYPVQGTFKATRIVNAQSIELPRKGNNGVYHVPQIWINDKWLL